MSSLAAACAVNALPSLLHGDWSSWKLSSVRNSPVGVSGYQADPAAQLADNHFGLHMLVLHPDGTAVGWGQNQYGQVGTGGTSHVQTAQDSTALGQGNVAIALGQYHTAVLKRP